MIVNTKRGIVEIDDNIIKQFKDIMGYDIAQVEVENYALIASNRHHSIDLSKGVEIEILDELKSFAESKISI